MQKNMTGGTNMLYFILLRITKPPGMEYLLFYIHSFKSVPLMGLCFSSACNLLSDSPKLRKITNLHCGNQT